MVRMGNRQVIRPIRNDENQFLARNDLMRWILLLVLFGVGFGIRAIGVTKIPMNYHPIKQYRAALTSRAIYYSTLNDIPVWEKEVAATSLQRIGFLGPPVVDAIAAVGYLTLGREALWLPKLLSSLYWMIGAAFLYAIARKMMSQDAAFLSTAIFLFLPFGVSSSQSFQPDPLMIMLTIISIFLIIVHDQHRSTMNLFLMGVVSSAAILIKPVSLFIIFGAFIALQYHHKGLTRALIFNKDNVLFTFIALFPSFLYYGYGILNTANLDQQAQKSFLPQLLLQFNFWDGWLKRIRLSVGLTVFFGGMLGVFLYPAGWQKKLLFGLWMGYFVMCFAFTYTISTHDYYHLPLFPIIALSLGSMADLLMQNLRQKATSRYLEWGIWAILLVSLFLGAGTNVQALRRLPDYQPEIRLAEEIGQIVSHSTKTILLAPYDGKPLMYYAKIAGQFWPYWFDIRDEKLWVNENINPRERMAILSKGLDPEYFIITDLEEFENQSDLKQYLNENYQVIVGNSRFLIYDLTAGQ
jgi:hypothetical protein